MNWLKINRWFLGLTPWQRTVVLNMLGVPYVFAMIGILSTGVAALGILLQGHFIAGILFALACLAFVGISEFIDDLERDWDRLNGWKKNQEGR